MVFRDKVFSEFEARQMNFAFEGGADGARELCPVECLGSVERECDVRNVTKKCRGVISKNRTYGAGSGTLKMTAHMPYDLYIRMFGMDEDKTLAEGVRGYGYFSKHAEACVTALILDEDANVKYVAYPNCVVSTGPVSKITNGEEEVAESEFEIKFAAGDHGMGFYEAPASDVSEDIAAKWMDEFTPALAHVATV